MLISKNIIPVIQFIIVALLTTLNCHDIHGFRCDKCVPPDLFMLCDELCIECTLFKHALVHSFLQTLGNDFATAFKRFENCVTFENHLDTFFYLGIFQSI